MQNKLKLAAALLLLLTSFGMLFVNSSSKLTKSAEAGINENFEELSPSFNWANFFLTESGTAGNANHFGAYAFEELNGELLIGIGRARPAESSGSMLVKYDGSTVTNIGLLNEQGFVDMVSTGSSVVIAGSDPAPWPTGTPPQLWEWGNVYITDGDSLTKYRETSGLDGVIHTFSISRAADGTLYSATGSQDGTHNNQTGTCVLGTTCYGEIFRSTNGGSVWETLGPAGPYRNFDVAEFAGRLYTLSSSDSTLYQPYLQYSNNNGANWTTITLPTEIHRTHFVEFNGQLLILGYDDSTIYGINPDNSYDTYTLDFDIGYADVAVPTFRNYNQFVVANDGFLYTIERGGRVMRSSDLEHWDELYDADRSFISIGYWAAQNAIVLGERGTAGSVWMIDIDNGDVVQILNLASDLNAIDLANSSNLENPSHQHTGYYRVSRLLTNADIPLADLVIDLVASRDWATVSGAVDIELNKSFVHNLAAAPGSYGTFDLYVPKTAEQTSVMICPNAMSLEDVEPDCSGGIEKFEVDSDTDIVTINSNQYWRVTGLTGTGGVSLPALSASTGGGDDGGGDSGGGDSGSGDSGGANSGSSGSGNASGGTSGELVATGSDLRQLLAIYAALITTIMIITFIKSARRAKWKNS
ncbi:MAG: hypothetical protein QY318_04745 [Candidatus Dojkabacteria bacterium]|nr:MAG: hypothetical protein QY318_04745 [Candidatus Dojkabacteria bacterium]